MRGQSWNTAVLNGIIAGIGLVLVFLWASSPWIISDILNHTSYMTEYYSAFGVFGLVAFGVISLLFKYGVMDA